MTAAERVTAAWGDPPAWVSALARAIDGGMSQAEAGRRIGYTPAVVSLVLQNRYKGSLENVERSVRVAFMAGTVNCPILGEISEADCVENQRLPFAATSSQRVRLYKACRNCAHNPANGESGDV